jgi:DNA-binding transcriptional MocR family regulator
MHNVHNFSNAQPEQIEEGIKRLGEVLYEALGARQPI